MEDVFPSYGCVILTTIAAMIRMSPHTCVGNVTALLDGNVVPDNRTTDAFLNGCSVMEKTIAEITVMNYQKIVPNVQRKRTSSVTTTVVFQSKL